MLKRTVSSLLLTASAFALAPEPARADNLSNVCLAGELITYTKSRDLYFCGINGGDGFRGVSMVDAGYLGSYTDEWIYQQHVVVMSHDDLQDRGALIVGFDIIPFDDDIDFVTCAVDQNFSPLLECDTLFEPLFANEELGLKILPPANARRESRKC